MLLAKLLTQLVRLIVVGASCAVVVLLGLKLRLVSNDLGAASLLTAIVTATLLLWTLSMLWTKLRRSHSGTAFALALVNKSTTKHAGGVVLAASQGHSISPLRPAGKVRISGKRYDAIAQEGYLSEGQVIEVVSSGAFGLVVRAASMEKA